MEIKGEQALNCYWDNIMTPFRGEQEYNLDEKGRILIPIKYREGLGEAVILARGGLGQINVYPKSFFEEMQQHLETSGEGESIQLASRFLSAAIECEVDRQGRLLIPPILRRHAKLISEAVIVGNRDHLEIWQPESWELTYNAWVAGYRENTDNYAKIHEMGIRL